MRRPVILYAGTYEQDYPRNRQLIRLLRTAGCDVRELHVPVWERFQDKSRSFNGAGGTLWLILLMISAYVRLSTRVLANIRQADAVAIGYIGQFDMLVLGVLARVAGKPVLFNPLVTLTDTLLEDRALVASDSLQGFAIGLIDRASLSVASQIVVDTDQNAAYLSQHFTVPDNKMRTISVGADESIFRVPLANQRSSTNKDGLHVLFYGKMIPLHGIDTLLKAIELLLDCPGYTFEVVGSGQLDSVVQQFASRIDTERFVYRPWVAYSRLPNRIASADCVLGIFGTTPKAARVIPNKVFQAMAMGSPIVTADTPAVRQVLVDGQSALLIPPGESTALAEAIMRMADPELRGRLGAGARAAFERFGSDAANLGEIQLMIQQLVPDAAHRSGYWA